MRNPLYVLATTVVVILALAGCGTDQNATGETTASSGTTQTMTAQKYNPPQNPPPAPEPADAPPVSGEPAGNLVELESSPEGLEADPDTGLVAVGLRNPDRLVLVDGVSREVVRGVDLPESPRHLALANPGGPVLIPAERANELVQVSLPGAEIVARTPVGDFPHGAAAARNGRIFVINELESTVSVIENERVIQTLETLLQPGGIAATGEGLVGVVGVRGLGLEVFDASTLESVGRIDAGEGPTHAVAGPDNHFYVADTRGDAVLVYEARPELRQVSRISVPGGSPYGLAIDSERGHLWVTLTAENRLVQYDITLDAPRRVRSYPTVRGANSVTVNPDTGLVYVAGAANNELQVINPEQSRSGSGTGGGTTGGG